MSLPAFTPNTPTFNDEGEATTGWTQTNATLSKPDSTTVRAAPTASGTATIRRTISLPSTGKSWCLYIKGAGSQGTGQYQTFELIGATSRHLYVYLNHDGGTTQQTGTIAIRTVSAAGAVKSATCATGIDTTAGVDLMVHYNAKFGSISVYFRQADNRWKCAAQIAGASWAADLMLTSHGTTGHWVEWDFITMVAPDALSIGDSGVSGFPGFSPKLIDNLNDSDSTWQRWCALAGRNSFIVNMGVAGQGSGAIAARINADAVLQEPKLVFLSACANDLGAGVSQTTRTANIQSSVTELSNAGIKVVLKNCGYFPEAYGPNPESRDYSKEWWDDYRPTLTGVDMAIDTTVPTLDANGFQDTAYTTPDPSHLNNAGHQLEGEYIAAQ